MNQNLNLKDAQARSDYRFECRIDDHLRAELIGGRIEELEPNGDFIVAAAIMEVGYVDIELNIHAYCQIFNGASPDDKRPDFGYFICCKNGEDRQDWESDQYADGFLGKEGMPNVDWKADDWAERLEQDMFRVLLSYVSAAGYSFDHPNRATTFLRRKEA